MVNREKPISILVLRPQIQRYLILAHNNEWENQRTCHIPSQQLLLMCTGIYSLKLLLPYIAHFLCVSSQVLYSQQEQKLAEL